MDEGRALSFGSVAELYDAFRPSPPDQLEDVLGRLDGLDVLELGAGTGIMTRFLVGLGARMTAVEPDDQMRGVLLAKSPDVTALKARAEKLPLEDACMDLVVTSSAWHWFQQPDTALEIARVLRDRGRLFVVGNGLDRSHQLLESLVALRVPGATPDPGRKAHDAAADLDDLFIDVAPLRIDWTWRRDHEQLVQLFHTYSDVINSSPAEQATIDDAVRAELARLAPVGQLDVPMALRGIAATRATR